MERYIKGMDVIEFSRSNAAEWPQRSPEVREFTLKCFMARLGGAAHDGTLATVERTRSRMQMAAINPLRKGGWALP